MYEIEWSTDAQDDLSYFKRHEQVRILAETDRHLHFEPTTATSKRKRLRSNRTADWELRVGDFRVFYDVDEHVRTLLSYRLVKNMATQSSCAVGGKTYDDLELSCLSRREW